MRIAFLKRNIPKRPAAIAVALIAAASMVAGREKPAIEPVEAKAPRTAAAAPAEPDFDLAKLQRAEAPAPHNDPFARRSFAPPPRPAPAAAAPAAPARAPQAPPLPFKYAGRITQAGHTEVYVLRGDELISIAAGQEIDGQYRVETISESSIAFMYLPLKTHQSIELREASG
jgi:hypothetical protein